jgi:hypothetical protein
LTDAEARIIRLELRTSSTGRSIFKLLIIKVKLN